MQPVDAVARHLDRVAFSGEPALQGTGRELIVFDHENAHVTSLPPDG